MEAAEAQELPALGPALRGLLRSEAKHLRRAVEAHGRGGGGAGAESSSSEGGRKHAALWDALEAVARFVGAQGAALAGGGGADEAVDPVVDPLLEHVVRPPAGGGGGKSKAGDSDATADAASARKAALRVLTWLLTPGSGSAARVGAVLVVRCAPPTAKRMRLAACIALRHAAVNLSGRGFHFPFLSST
jgi:hypothetical protein